ncbi:hypothetical protein [Cohnella cellulosilytica]|uniref:Uncharacterized protein n=1 Tax=Cohnella cellulosilytica TaxID=986710 RepID=A0ABW2FHF2_9BACL
MNYKEPLLAAFFEKSFLYDSVNPSGTTEITAKRSGIFPAASYSMPFGALKPSERNLKKELDCGRGAIGSGYDIVQLINSEQLVHF